MVSRQLNNTASSRSTTSSFILRIYFLTIQFLVFLHSISAAEDDNTDDDKDEAKTYTFRTAFLKSLPWGGATAFIYLILFSTATHNLGGPAGLLVPIIWVITIFICPPFFALVISLPLFLTKGEHYWLITSTFWVIMSMMSVPCAWKLYDPDFED